MAEAAHETEALGRKLTAELTLAAACCHWPPSPEGNDRVKAAAARVLDWDRFDALVRRNRISPLVQRALASAGVDLPDAVAEGLAARSLRAARRALIMAGESIRLQRLLEAEGIATMVVKGTPLAMLAYGELGIKEAADIDLLVLPEDALKARQILLRLGSEMQPPMSEAEFLRFAEHDKEAIFWFGGSRVTVELHWRLITHRALLREVDAHGPEQFVSFPGGTLRTLADEPLFAFLCLHGALHNWSRLKWLADVSAFLGVRSPEQVEQLYRAAEGYGAGRSAAAAMLLCCRLFGLALAPNLLTTLQRDTIARALADNVVAGLSYRHGTAEHEGYSPPWFRMKAAQFFLAPGVSHLVDHARVAWISPFDRAQIALPRQLGFMYHVLRIPLWVGRTCRKVADTIRS